MKTSQILIIISAVIAGLLVATGINAINIDQVQQEESTPPPPQPAPVSTEEAPTDPSMTNIEQQVETVTQAIADVQATGQSQEVTLDITEAEANELAAEWLAMMDMPEDAPLEIKSARIDFQPGNNVRVEGDTLIQNSISLPIEVISQVSIEQGAPKANITDIIFPGSALLPPSMKDEINNYVRQQYDVLLAQLIDSVLGNQENVDVEVTDIKTGEKAMTITALIMPKS